MNIKQAIKIITDERNHTKHHLTEKGKAEEFYQELGDFVIAYDKAILALEFAEWVADEIFDDYWEYNKDAFAEIACRKLCKLGLVDSIESEYGGGGLWKRIENE